MKLPPMKTPYQLCEFGTPTNDVRTLAFAAVTDAQISLLHDSLDPVAARAYLIKAMRQINLLIELQSKEADRVQQAIKQHDQKRNPAKGDSHV